MYTWFGATTKYGLIARKLAAIKLKLRLQYGLLALPT
jgi:hypothetical protein